MSKVSEWLRKRKEAIDEKQRRLDEANKEMGETGPTLMIKRGSSSFAVAGISDEEHPSNAGMVWTKSQMLLPHEAVILGRWLIDTCEDHAEEPTGIITKKEAIDMLNRYSTSKTKMSPAWYYDLVMTLLHGPYDDGKEGEWEAMRDRLPHRETKGGEVVDAGYTETEVEK